MVNWRGYGRKLLRAKFKILFWDFNGGIKLKVWKDSGIRGETVEFRVDDLPNVSQQRYRWASFTGSVPTCPPSDARCTVLVCLSMLSAIYTLSQTERFYCVTSYLTEKLSKQRSFDTQKRRPQNCPFQSSFTRRTAQFIQGIPHKTTALFLSTTVTRKRRHTELTKQPDKPNGKPVLCHRKFSCFSCSFFYTVKVHSLTCVWGLLRTKLRKATCSSARGKLQYLGTAVSYSSISCTYSTTHLHSVPVYHTAKSVASFYAISQSLLSELSYCAVSHYCWLAVLREITSYVETTSVCVAKWQGITCLLGLLTSSSV
jgi:hypothetical protein